MHFFESHLKHRWQRRTFLFFSSLYHALFFTFAFIHNLCGCISPSYKWRRGSDWISIGWNEDEVIFSPCILTRDLGKIAQFVSVSVLGQSSCRSEKLKDTKNSNEVFKNPVFPGICPTRHNSRWVKIHLRWFMLLNIF